MSNNNESEVNSMTFEEAKAFVDLTGRVAWAHRISPVTGKRPFGDEGPFVEILTLRKERREDMEEDEVAEVWLDYNSGHMIGDGASGEDNDYPTREVLAGWGEGLNDLAWEQSMCDPDHLPHGYYACYQLDAHLGRAEYVPKYDPDFVGDTSSPW